MKIFLAAPLTAMLRVAQSETSFDQSFRTLLELTTEALTTLGHQVFSAHAREKWGEDIWDPQPALIADLRGIDESDALIAIVGNPASPGVQLEVGYAVALGKPLYVCFEQDEDQLPHLCQGLRAIESTRMIKFSRARDLVESLSQQLALGSS